jgi:hypothetical protein
LGAPYAGIAPPGIDPLTGLKVDNPDNLERRPVAVKITTFPRSVRGYQAGLSLADVVYEYYIEDGLTRFVAVYYGNDAERAGPVRSGRYFDEHIMRMYHSALVFVNADERVEKYLLESDLKHFLFVPRPDNCPPLCDDPTIEGYNDYFVNTAGVGPLLTDNKKQPLLLGYFSNAVQNVGTQIQRIYTTYSIYSYNYWAYDAERNLYLRYSDAADADNGQIQYSEHIDHFTGSQITADNVVVLVVPHRFKNEYDRVDQVFDIDLSDVGSAYVFRGGRMLQAIWQRPQLDQPIQLFDGFNRPIALKPGVTFYQVINPESNIAQDSDSVYFTFSAPPRSPQFTATLTDIPFKATRTPKPKNP